MSSRKTSSDAPAWVSVCAILLCFSFLVWMLNFVSDTDYSRKNAEDLKRATDVCAELGSGFTVVRAPDDYRLGHILSSCLSVTPPSAPVPLPD